MLERVLTSEGYHTLLLASSDRLFDVINKERPDLIILDIWLAESDSGWQLLERLRQEPVTQHIPVLVCSGDTFRLHEKAPWLAEWGCRVLEKPFDIDHLLGQLRDVLQSPATNLQDKGERSSSASQVRDPG